MTASQWPTSITVVSKTLCGHLSSVFTNSIRLIKRKLLCESRRKVANNIEMAVLLLKCQYKKMVKCAFHYKFNLIVFI